MAPTPDFDSYPRMTAISSGEASPGARWVEIDWSDGRKSRFHNVWLRDNCPCSECVHPGTKEQTFEVLTVAADEHPRSVCVDERGDLSVVWTTGAHGSVYDAGWLRAHCYAEAAASTRSTMRVWDSSSLGEPPTFEATSVMADDDVLYAWLCALRDYGCSRVRGLARTLDAVGDLARRIGPIRDTNFGLLWDVWTEPAPVTNANTALPLPPHVDLPTREYQPGIQFLHCLANEATGRDSILVDGQRIAEILRRESGDHFRTLTTVPWNWANRA